MTVGLLVGSDHAVGEWLYQSVDRPHYKFDRAIGLVRDGAICGAVLFHGWNGSNLEVTYIGKDTLTAGIVRSVARFAVHTFDPGRVTAVVSKKKRRFIKSLIRFGWRLEGTQRCYYGKRDCSRNTGVRFVLFREQIDKLAGLMPVQETEAA